MVIAFDFDGVMDNSKIQNLVKKLIREKNEVWVVTARRESEYNKNKVTQVTNKLFMSEYRILYSDDKPKYELLQTINADIYIDNKTDEFQIINNYTNTTCFLWQNIQ